MFPLQRLNPVHSLFLKVRAKNLIVIVGPTAVGKTALSVALATHLHGQIVSADSRQMYREMVIGTAKPSPIEQGGIPHHFIDSHSIHQPLDAAGFGAVAREVLATLFQQHNTVIVCGGSGLYLQALLEGFDDMPPVPPDVREAIVAGYHQQGLSWLQEQVQQLDPAHFEKMDQQNPQRLMRALELLRVAGQPLDRLRKGRVSLLPYHIIRLGLEVPRPELYARINARVDEMIARGLWAEAESLFVYRNQIPLQTVGYQEIFDAIQGIYDQGAAIDLIKRNTRKYAKRQLTWFKRDETIRWFHPDNRATIFRWIDSQLRQND